MKNRILRGEILDSERFLNLATNTERICFISLLLKADDYANMEGSIPRIQRLWRDFGIDSQEKTSKILDALADQDLIRFYKNQKDFEDTKQYIHIPRFRQRLRFTKRVNPLSPWNEPLKNNTLIPKKSDYSKTIVRLQSDYSKPEVEVEVEKEVEKNKNTNIAKAISIFDFLNKKTNKNFLIRNPNNTFTKNYYLLIKLFNKGYSVQQIKSVIAVRSRLWLKDDKMSDYLRPQTLFSQNKFESYFADIQRKEVDDDLS